MTDELERAVVLGGGYAGLLAARVLSDHAREVVVVERDRLPVGTADRRGAVQGRHVHALLARGQLILEGLLPGITEELAARGGRVGDVLEQTRMYFSGHRMAPGTSGLTLVSATRPLLESCVRDRVRPRVRLLEGCDVTGFALDRGADRVRGACVRHREDGGAEEVIEGDLVVDATGRGSQTPAWLEQIGVAPPPEVVVRVDVAYATRRYRLTPEDLDGDIGVINAPTPTVPRAGVVATVEDDTALVTLGGMAGDRPPIDPAGFEAYAGTLQFPDVGDAIADAEPLDEPVRHRFPTSTWRRYDRCRLPDRLAVLGDAVCSLNPIYGQGMTVAALEVDALRRHLEQHGPHRLGRWQRRLGRVVAGPWQMATGGDLQFPGVEGRRRSADRAVAGYVRRLHAAAAADPALSEAFVRVAGMVDAPTALLRPGVAARVLRR